MPNLVHLWSSRLSLPVPVPCHLATAAMSNVPDGSLDKQLSGDEDKSDRGRHVRKGSSHGKGSSGSRSGSSVRETNRGVRQHSRGHGSGAGDDSASPPTCSLPSTSRDEANSPPWTMVMEALAALRSDMDKLKEERSLATSGGADVAAAPGGVNSGPAGQELLPSSSPAGFSGFPSVVHRLSSDDSDSQDDVPPGSVLLQCARAYGPVDDVSAGIDRHVAGMVNHVFDNSLREKEYKEILEDVATK